MQASCTSVPHRGNSLRQHGLLVFLPTTVWSMCMSEGLKRVARGSLKIQDAKESPKIATWAPSHNFVGLYLRN